MLDSAERLSKLFADNPLSAFVAILVLACAALAMQLRAGAQRLSQEQTEHLKTAREVSTLATQMRQTWDDQLDQNHRTLDLQERTVNTLERSVTLLEARRT